VCFLVMFRFCVVTLVLGLCCFAGLLVVIVL